MKRLRTLLALRGVAAGVMTLTACTYGAPGSGGSAGPGGVTTIDVSLTAFGATTISAGRSAGFSPAVTTVPVGTQIRFHNADSFAHTASAVSGTAFPTSSPLTASALSPSADGFHLSAGGWSSGNLAAGADSPVFTADAPGTYLFGCFYHYGAPMRGAIVVQ